MRRNEWETALKKQVRNSWAEQVLTFSKEKFARIVEEYEKGNEDEQAFATWLEMHVEVENGKVHFSIPSEIFAPSGKSFFAVVLSREYGDETRDPEPVFLRM